MQNFKVELRKRDLDTHAMDKALKSIGFEMHGNTPAKTAPADAPQYSFHTTLCMQK